MVSRALAAGGGEAQKSEWLPKLANGDVIAACGHSGDVKADGGKLGGTVRFVPHGANADLLLNLLVAGIKIPGARRKIVKMVFHHLAAEALGGAQETIDRTVAYSRERIQFGRPIGSFQAYKHRLADMMIETEQARSAVYWAACAVDEGAEEAEFALHAAKTFCADTFFMCAGNMIQLHGGIGFTWEHDAHLFFKRARSIQTLLKDGAWHRERIAAQLFGEME
jgi:alkylation response protein AidB-like acyl-CoA dehydrogenase